jgi:lactoylglutathione lyase
MKLGYILFYVDDVQASMSFYEKAFDLKKGFLHESNQYGEMITGETKLGFVGHETAKSHGFEYQKSNLSQKSFANEVGLIADNVDHAFSKAVAAGAIPVSAPKKKPWGQIVSYVRDLNGNLVEICSAIG